MGGDRVLVIAYEGVAHPSTRLRILQYVPTLQAHGFGFDRLFVPQERVRQPMVGLAEKLEWADVVFVQRVLRRDLLRAVRRAGKPVIFDVDDAIHLIRQSQYPSAVMPHGVLDIARNTYRAVLRGSRFYGGRKRLLDEMLDLATKIIVGNKWLFDELGLSDQGAVIHPTSVWLNGVSTKRHEQHRPVTIGWIGVKSNLYHLELLRDTFTVLHERYKGEIELSIVSSEPIRAPLPTRFTPWSLETENDSVLSFDLGIMPLQDDPFSRGKCAFKAVFCMSRGVPVVASPVGANTALIEHGVNGLLALSTDDWVDNITALVEDHDLRARMGLFARQTVEERYSAGAVAEALSGILLQVERASWSAQLAKSRSLQ